VIVEVVEPSATTEAGLAFTVEIDVLAAAGFTVKLLLVAPIGVPSVADSVYDPLLVGTRFENVATPFTAATLNVDPPLKTPPLLIAIATVEESVVTTLPLASCTCTVIAGLIALPAVVVDGCWRNASFVAAPLVMLNALLVVEVSPLLVAANV
jgi:hypothetical protein